MKAKKNTYDDIHSAYLGVLADVWHYPEYRVAPRGLPIREKLDYSFTITNPKSEFIKTADVERNKVIARYSQDELDLYQSCSNRVEDFTKASKFWGNIAAPDGTITSAYGYLIWKQKSHGHPLFEGVMRTPWEWCVDSLKADKDTRQALLRFSLPEHFWKGNKDLTCTTHANFSIRDNKLNLSVVMRSNDMVKGLAYDLPFFISLGEKMVDELKDTYPELKVGSYSHMAHSLHCYEKDEEVIRKMLGDFHDPLACPLTYADCVKCFNMRER